MGDAAARNGRKCRFAAEIGVAACLCALEKKSLAGIHPEDIHFDT